MKRPSSSKVRMNFLESKRLKIHAFIGVGIFAQSERQGVQVLIIGCAPEILADEDSPTPREQPSSSGSGTRPNEHGEGLE
jgi:hypothetical protein